MMCILACFGTLNFAQELAVRRILMADGSWMNYVPGTWVICRQPLPLAQLREQLFAATDGGQFLLIEFDHVVNVDGYLPADAWPWLEQYLRRHAVAV